MKNRIFRNLKTTISGIVLAILTALQGGVTEPKQIILVGAIAGLGALSQD
jgi:hypothetical protein